MYASCIAFLFATMLAFVSARHRPDIFRENDTLLTCLKRAQVVYSAEHYMLFDPEEIERLVKETNLIDPKNLPQLVSSGALTVKCGGLEIIDLISPHSFKVAYYLEKCPSDFEEWVKEYTAGLKTKEAGKIKGEGEKYLYLFCVDMQEQGTGIFGANVFTIVGAIVASVVLLIIIIAIVLCACCCCCSACCGKSKVAETQV